MRVIERRDRAGLAFEPFAPVGVGGKLCRQDFDGHRPVEPRVAGAVHLSHPAGAKQAGDFIRAEARAGREWHGARLSLAGTGASAVLDEK